jgi:hypothetical protein
MCISPTDALDDPSDHSVLIVLTRSERDVLASLVRGAIRKRDRAMRRGQVAFGDAWDPTRVQVRLDLLISLYARLGKDPDRITGR